MMEFWLTPELAQRLAGSLLHFIWQGGVIAMIAAIALRLLVDRSAESRYAVSVAALLLMLAVPLVTFAFYTQTGRATLALLRSIDNGFTAATSSATQAATTSAWTQWIVLVWLIGVVFCSIRLLAGWRISRSLTTGGISAVPSEIQQSFNEIVERLALTRPVQLLVSLRIDTPVAVGWLRPVVLVPLAALTGLTADQLRAVFAHELAHIRRHDFLVNMIQRGVEAILFYHPAVWWLSGRIRCEREHCCDDLAVEICGDRSAYAQALIELEHVRSVDPELAVPAAGGRLTQRISRVLGYRIVENDGQSALAALLFVVAWVMVGLWQSGSTLVAKPVAPPPVPVQIAAQSGSSLPGVAALNAIAAIVTAGPVQPIEPPQSASPGKVQTGAIEGVLRDDSGKPVPGVRVAAVPFADAGAAAVPDLPSATTDKDGRYRLDGIAPGQYSISAGRAEFPTFYPGTLNGAGSRLVTVAAGTSAANVDFAIQPMSLGRLHPGVVSIPSPTLGQRANQSATFGPGGTLTLFVSIQMEGGGRIPIFANGRFPKLRLTKVDTQTSYEMWFADIVITVPRNFTTLPDEYNVAVEDLPDGYAVKSITYRADEPGLRFEDVLHGTLRISARANDTVGAGSPNAVGAPDLPIAITLTRSAPPPASGVRVSGTSEGLISASRFPRPGESWAPAGRRMLDAGVYLSGKPGVLYADGTFEFAGVSPGLHALILYLYPPRFAVAEVAVGDQDVEGVRLQAAPVLPKDVFAPALPKGAADTTVRALASVRGRILDEATGQPIGFGYLTLSGIGGSTRTIVGTGNETFHIGNLLPGQYSLTAESKGYKTTVREVIIGYGDPPLEIRIARDPPAP